jgi:hypothetical protein
MHKPIAVALVLLAAAAPGRAMVTLHDHEQFGGAPVPASQGTWGSIAAVLNLPGRTYWRDHGSTGFGVDHHAIQAAYRGETGELNAALRVMAALPREARRDVVLLPGGGAVSARDGTPVVCNWRVQIEYSHVYDPRYRPANGPVERLTVTLTVFIPDRAMPAEPASPEQIDAWIADLDSPRFAARESAFQELARRAASVRPAVERALAGKPSLELRQRLQRLLQQAADIDLDRLRVPPGLGVTSFDRQLERERVGLLSSNPATLWEAAQELNAAVEGTDLLPLLAAQLSEPELAALVQKTKDAPNGYLLAFKPLTTTPTPTPAGAAGRYHDLRQRIDDFCRSLPTAP